MLLSPLRAQVAPIASSGIESLETSRFKLRCLQTLTGAKFVITAQPSTDHLETVLQGVYELYTDYVLKVGGARACWQSLAMLVAQVLLSRTRLGRHKSA